MNSLFIRLLPLCNDVLQILSNIHTLARVKLKNVKVSWVFLPSNIGDVVLLMPFIEKMSTENTVILYNDGLVVSRLLAKDMRHVKLRMNTVIGRRKNFLIVRYFTQRVKSKIAIKGTTFHGFYDVQIFRYLFAHLPKSIKVISESEPSHKFDVSPIHFHNFSVTKLESNESVLKQLGVSHQLQYLFTYWLKLGIDISLEDYFAYYLEKRKLFISAKEKVNNRILLPFGSKDFRSLNEKQIVDVYSEYECNHLFGVRKKIGQLNAKVLKPKRLFMEIANADIVVGVENGLTLLSSLFGIKTVVYIGGGHYGRIVPIAINSTSYIHNTEYEECFGCNWKCKFLDLNKEQAPCMSI